MSVEQKSGEFQIVGVLTIVFIVLKLTDVVGWSWWWVFSPVWIMILVLLVMAIGIPLYTLVRVSRSRRE